MVHPLPAGVVLHALFDSCHSGQQLTQVWLREQRGTGQNQGRIRVREGRTGGLGCMCGVAGQPLISMAALLVFLRLRNSWRGGGQCVRDVCGTLHFLAASTSCFVLCCVVLCTGTMLDLPYDTRLDANGGLTKWRRSNMRGTSGGEGDIQGGRGQCVDAHAQTLSCAATQQEGYVSTW